MKIFKIVLINIILIIIFLFIIELTLNIKDFIWRINTNKDFSPQIQQNFGDYFRYYLNMLNERYITYYAKNSNYYEIYKKRFRKPYGIDKYKNSSSIILFGCSYTYGTNISDENDIFSSQLSNYLHMPVYNLGIEGGGPREILYLLEDKRVFNDLNINKNKVKYIIYTFMDDHIRRIFVNKMPCVPYYKYKNNNLYFEKPNLIKNNEFLKKTKIYSSINDFYYYHKTEKDTKKIFGIFTTYIKEMSKLIESQFSNGKQKTKFIVLVYKPYNNIDFNKINFKDIKDQNINVIYLSELVDFNPQKVPYIVWEGDDHPSPLAWEKIIPELIKKIDN